MITLLGDEGRGSLVVVTIVARSPLPNRAGTIGGLVAGERGRREGHERRGRQ